VTGRDADVNAGAGFRGKRTYLSFKRDSIHGGTLFRGMALTDLCIIYANKGDSCPRGFTRLNKNLNTGMVGSDVFLCYKKSMVKPASLNYRACMTCFQTLVSIITVDTQTSRQANRETTD
jgi:hypothetical protein